MNRSTKAAAPRAARWLHAVLAGGLLAAALAAPAARADSPPSMLDPTVTQVAAGNTHTCALSTAGAVTCWGYNRFGQLGSTTNNGNDNANPAPQPVMGLSSGVAAIAAGAFHACALSTAGAVSCWGSNDYGQLGNPANSGTGNPNPTPQPVTGLSSGVAAIAAMGFQTCALTTAGAVMCWGLNQFGQLGNPTNNGNYNPNPTPQTVTDLSGGVAAIAAGDHHTCALTTAGAVMCWGENYYGQLGNPNNNGNFNPNPMPQTVTGLGSGVAAITAGWSHTCALSTAGAVTCWGYNANGQLGNPANSGTNNANPMPQTVAGLSSGVAAIAAGKYHTCALTPAGAVTCWGWNYYGQLGNPTNNGNNNANPAPQAVTGLSSGVAAIATGEAHTCALTTAGAIRCWGSNQYGQLGNPANSGTTNANPTPSPVSGYAQGVAYATRPVTIGGTPVAQPVGTIAAGAAHTCALTPAGAVTCWGRNDAGQLGNPTNNGNTNPNPTPLAVTGLNSSVAAIAAGDSHTCALTTAGAVTCWGLNSSGQLGNTTNNGNNNANPTPQTVAGLSSGVVAITAGDSHTCALTTAGAVMCWGYNWYGQLGNPTNSGNNNANPTPLAVTGLSSGVVAIAAGDYHTCALSTTGAVTCWGRNFNGQLGNTTNNGNGNANPTPQPVTGLSSVAAITAGANHTCALSTAGAVTCWGSNAYGQLGNPTNSGNSGNANPAPLAVTGLSSGVTGIAAGANHTCALTTAGAVTCWGYNSYGQLGNTTNSGTTNPNPTPQPVAGLSSGAAAIAAGAFHTCALTPAGAVTCWGYNWYGQLGNPTNNGNANANPLPLALRSGQSLAFNPPAPAVPLTTILAGGTLSLAAQASAGGSAPVVYDVWTPDTCAVSATTLTATGGVGSLCGVRASRADGDDGAGGTTAAAPQQLRWVQIAGIAPQITSANGTTFTYASAGSFTLTSSGVPAATLSLAGTDTLPAGVTFADQGDGSALLAGTPSQTGNWTLHVSATNGAGTATQTFTLTVDRAEQATLTLTATPTLLIPGMSSQLSASGGSGSGALGYAVDSGPCSVNDAIATATDVGTCTLRATKAADANYNATSATVEVTVQAADLPTAQPQSVPVSFNTAAAITLHGSDGNIGGPYTLIYAIATNPAHGTISGFDPSAGTLTYTPNPNVTGADSFTFTVISVNGTSPAATVSVQVIAPQLDLTIADGREFARYGQVINYIVTLRSGGDAANAVPLQFTLSAGMDGDYARVTCFGAGDGASCTQDASDPLHYTVTLPPNRSLTWLVSVPVRSDAGGDDVTFGASAIGAGSATDINTLVVFKDGFDVPYGDGTQGDGTQAVPVIEGAEATAILDGDASRAFELPPASGDRQIDDVLILRAKGEAVRVQRFAFGAAAWVRLLHRAADGRERVSGWVAVDAGARLSIGSVVDQGARWWLLEGARSRLTLGGGEH